jgi:Domain of unknown function (DUF4823)
VNKIAIALLLFLAACSNKYRTDSFQPPAEALSRSKSAYIMLARDGNYGGKTYAASGRLVSQQLFGAVTPRLNKTEMATSVESREQAIAAARGKALAYVFEPVILNWEDRATEWSGRPDRITIMISVWDAASGKSLASGTERASSKWFTFGGDHPQDLVPVLMSNFANRVIP